MGKMARSWNRSGVVSDGGAREQPRPNEDHKRNRMFSHSTPPRRGERRVVTLYNEFNGH